MSTTDQPDEQEIKVVVCQPFGTYNEISTVIPNSTVIRASCKHLTWLSPQGAFFLHENPDALTACYDCRPDSDENYLVPGARDAAMIQWGDERVAEFDRQMAPFQLKEWTDPQ